MDERDELLELTRRVRERLAWYQRGGVAGVPRPEKRPVPPTTAMHRPAVGASVGPVDELDPRAALARFTDQISDRPRRPPVAATPAPAYQSPAPASALPPAPTGIAASGPRGAAGLQVIREDLGDCQRCGLGKTRKNIVYGVGNPNAPLVFVGESPGENEDLTGEPFVGKAGELLTRMIAAMGFAREDIYICNVVKCRPPGNRNPLPDEITACEPFLIRQVGAIAPRVIVALGKFAAQTLLRNEAPISALRGNWHRYQGIALMPTFHPAFLLRNPESKKQVWEDLKKVIAELDRLGVPHGTVGMRQG